MRANRRSGFDRGGSQQFSHPALHYKKPKELKRFQTLIVLAASAALVFGLYGFVWYIASAWVKSQVTDWVDTQRANGAVAEFATMETAGFPARITLKLSEPHYQGPVFGRAVDWQGESLSVTARPWSPWRLVFNVSGRHRLDLAGQNYSGTAQTLRGVAELGERWPERLDLTVRGLAMDGTAPLGVSHLQMALRHKPGARASETGLQVRLNAENVTIPGGLPQPLGDVVEVLNVSARLSGEVEPGAFRDRLPAWRDSGGALEVDRLQLRSGHIGLAAAGRAVLDDALQPEGTFTTKIEGLFQVLEILRARGVMSGSQTVMATMALSALSKRPKDGGAPSINLSVGMEDGVLSLGPLKLGKMPAIDWGFPATSEPAEETPAEPAPEPRNYKDVKPVL